MSKVERLYHLHNILNQRRTPISRQELMERYVRIGVMHENVEDKNGKNKNLIGLEESQSVVLVLAANFGVGRYLRLALYT